MSRRVTRSATRAALASLQANAPVEGRTPSRSNKQLHLRTPASRKSVATPSSRLKKKAKLTLTPAAIDDCIICMDALGTEGGHVKLSCGHSFCRQCIATHAARQLRHEQPASCALCKNELTEAEIEGCGPAKEMQEESDDEEDGEVMVIMEFEADDEEEGGFWLMYDMEDEEYDSEEEGWVTCDDDEEDDIEEVVESSERADLGPTCCKPGAADREGEQDCTEQDCTQDGGLDDSEEPDDPRPYGGWRWSASHRAWVGNASVTCPPPRGPPTEPVAGPDPLEGQRIQGVLSMEARLELYGEVGETDGEVGEVAHDEGGHEQDGHTAKLASHAEVDTAEADAVEGAGEPEATRALTRATKLTLNSDPV